MNRIHTAARTAVAIGAVGVAVLGFAPIASAASGDTVYLVVNHANQTSYTYTSNGSPAILGTAEPNCSGNPTDVTLTVAGPGVVTPTIGSHAASCSQAVTLQPAAKTVDTAHPVWSAGGPAMNGTYTVTLNNEGRTTAAKFTLLIPPTKTAGFAVTPSGTNAKFAWTPNSEPDVLGYVIKDRAGKTLAEVPTRDCSRTSCSDGPLSLGKSVAGHTETFTIVAARSCGGAPCSSGAVMGNSPSTASAKFARASSSSPSGNGHSGKSGGSLSDGGTKTKAGGKTGTLSDPGGNKALHHKGTHAGSLSAFAGGSLPSLEVPSLPSGAITSTAGSNSSGEPKALGKPGGNLKYPAPQLAIKKTVTTSGGSFTHEVSVAVNEKPLWRGIAAAAVLLLVAVHLRTWAGREDYL